MQQSEKPCLQEAYRDGATPGGGQHRKIEGKKERERLTERQREIESGKHCDRREQPSPSAAITERRKQVVTYFCLYSMETRPVQQDMTERKTLTPEC